MFFITLMDITPLLDSLLSEQQLYRKAFSLVTATRQEKILKLGTDKARCCSLAAGLLFNYTVGRFVNHSSDTKLPPISTSPQIVSAQTAVVFYNPQYHFETAVLPDGKPYFPSRPGLFFNLSHSGHYAACIVSDHACGIDIEGGRNVKLSVAKRFFSDFEYHWIADTKAPALQEQRFLRLWTLKEAYAKTTGHGIAKEISQAVYTPVPESDVLTFANPVYNAQYEIAEYEYNRFRIAAIIQK